MARVIAGIDPSLSNTAIVYGDDTDKYRCVIHHSKPRGDGCLARFERYRLHVAAVVDELLPLTNPLVLLEGYSYGSKGNAILTIAEWGGLLRNRLINEGIEFVEVSPKTLKQFAAGNGNANKIAVSTHITNRYGVLLASDDEYDAYALFRLGLCVVGQDKPQTKKQQEAVKSLENIR